MRASRKSAPMPGVPVDMHDCGRCEDFIPDWIEFGVRMMESAQVMNDLVGIQEKVRQQAGALRLLGLLRPRRMAWRF